MTLKIAVDIDGVLADQVTLVLEKIINPRYSIKLKKEDITEWDYKIEDTNIKVEIENALLDNDYVLSLPLIEGAKEGMDYLRQNHFIIIATSRPKETENATVKWVKENFKFNEFCNTRGKDKSCIQSDILIDDYIPNIEKFIKNKGIGLLFSQPWNQNRSSILGMIENGKIYCCNGWNDVQKVVENLTHLG